MLKNIYVPTSQHISTCEYVTGWSMPKRDEEVQLEIIHPLFCESFYHIPGNHTISRKYTKESCHVPPQATLEPLNLLIGRGTHSP